MSYEEVEFRGYDDGGYIVVRVREASNYREYIAC